MKNFNFGNYICELREKKGLSQSQLGEQLGVSNKAVSKWENGGAYPSTELMLPLAKALGVSLEDLYRAVSDSKAEKTKSRLFLDWLGRHFWALSAVCIALVLIPYILFAIVSEHEEKPFLLIATPVIFAIVYAMFYFMMRLSRKNPFANDKIIDRFSVFVLAVMTLGFVMLLIDFVRHFPNGYSMSIGACPASVMAIIQAHKKRYR